MHLVSDRVAIVRTVQREAVRCKQIHGIDCEDQESEARRINALFDAELTRLKALWAGLPPGSPDPAAASGAEPDAVSKPR